MTGPAFTPGPLKVVSQHAFEIGTFAVEPEASNANGGKVVAIYYGPHAEANAHLGTAAPELYEALEKLLARWNDYQNSDSGNQADAYYTLAKPAYGDWQDAALALAKARGEAGDTPTVSQ